MSLFKIARSASRSLSQRDATTTLFGLDERSFYCAFHKSDVVDANNVVRLTIVASTTIKNRASCGRRRCEDWQSATLSTSGISSIPFGDLPNKRLNSLLMPKLLINGTDPWGLLSEERNKRWTKMRSRFSAFDDGVASSTFRRC